MKIVLILGTISSIMVYTSCNVAMESTDSIPLVLQDGVRAVVLVTVFPQKTLESLSDQHRKKYEAAVTAQLQHVQGLLATGVTVATVNKSLIDRLNAATLRDVMAGTMYK